MKILYTFGGVPHYLDALLRRQQQKGAEIVTLTPERGNATIGKGVKMVGDNGAYRRLATPEKQMYYGKAAFPQLPEVVRSEKPDILVMGWPYFLQLFFQPALRKAIKQCGTKVMIREIPFQTPPFGKLRSYFAHNPVTDENMNLQSRGAGFMLRQLMIMLVRRYCYSQASATLNYGTVAYDILPSYGVKPEQINVTYNATDTEALLGERERVMQSEPLLPPSDHRILHIGRLVKWKRVDLLIDALPAVLKQFPDAELVVVGDGPELPQLQAQAEAAGIAAHVRFVGAVYDPVTLGAYMHESSVYVLAGMGGLSINDAMTYGMPVICSVCDGTERDLVIDGCNGFLFRPGDASDLVQKITTLFASPELCGKMRKESQRIILEKINLDAVADRYLAAFRKVLGR